MALSHQNYHRFARLIKVSTRTPEIGYEGTRTPAPLLGPNLKAHPMLGTILIVILVLMLIGALPRWGHSASWGYGPSGGLGLVLVILLILVLTGRM
ncbi:MAG: DUF3309 domain-containing protein [Pseudorhodobacter sp.]|nr:DUF3309 domain-containing protein [Pseudorhodobacter sp.]